MPENNLIEIYSPNSKHLANEYLQLSANEVIPIVSAVPYRNCIYSLSGHVFCRFTYVKTGIYNSYDTRELGLFQKLLYYGRSVVAKRKRLTGYYLIVHDLFSSNYYHWLCEALPRVYFLHRKYPAASLVLPKFYSSISFVTESLTILGIDVVYMEEGLVYSFDNLVISHSNPFYATPVPSLLTSLLRELKPQMNGTPFRMIYVSRKFAGKRKLVNESELIPVLERLGFEVVYTDEMTLKQQIALFGECKFLIGIHGAAFANILFMSPGTRVLEIRNPDWVKQTRIYFQLSNAMSIRWDYLMAKSCAIDNTNNADLSVDITELTSQILQTNK